MTRARLRRALIVGVAGTIAIFWISSSEWINGRTDWISYSELVRLAEDELLRSTSTSPLILTTSRLSGRYYDAVVEAERDFRTIIPYGSQRAVSDTLLAQGFIVKIQDDNQKSWTSSLLKLGLPLILFAGIILFSMKRNLRGEGMGSLLSLRKSHARLSVKGSKGGVTFEDVEGADEAKEDLREIVEFLRRPDRFRRLGGQIPRGVLLMGSPGTGKTLLARAVAGEADVPFFSISGSEFVEVFVGVGASRVRDLFKQGRQHAPCIIFIDEIDAIGRRRGAGLGGGHDEREQSLNQLLSEMDGFDSNEGVILIGATNRPDVLDPALLRPGRFDRHVVVPLPDIRGREGILRVHVRQIPLSDDVDIERLARGASGFSGAQLENLANEAALHAARLDQEVVRMADFEAARDKALMGKERRSLVLSQTDRLITAYHEAGHALVASRLPEADPVHKVTIIPRGRNLGTTVQSPEEDRYTSTKPYLETTISILMAGRCAEEIFIHTVTTGVAKDLKQATELAQKMVCEWGMSKTLGPLGFARNQGHVFLGREIALHRNYGKETSIQIDEEIKRIVIDGYERAREVLEGEQETLMRLANALLECETLDSNQLEAIITGNRVGPRLEKDRSVHNPREAA